MQEERAGNNKVTESAYKMRGMTNPTIEYMQWTETPSPSMNMICDNSGQESEGGHANGDLEVDRQGISSPTGSVLPSGECTDFVQIGSV